MDLLQIFLIDINNFEIDDLFPYVDGVSLAKYTKESIKKEKAASIYFKKRFVKNYSFNEFGKPISNNKFFNIAHSHGLVGYVEGTSDIGIDIEEIRDVNDELINYALSDEDKKHLKDRNDFFKMWVNKEALVKATGLGLTKNIKDIPSMPFNGTREYNGKKYTNRTFEYKKYVIAISMEGEDDYELSIKELTAF